ncbi:MAG: branched-chain amino acid ABC transporter permease, partial [Rhodospirillales bacterium]|nr:branched-chain amino acid ABC transporter permease [Rhodospirillales bacterium]
IAVVGAVGWITEVLTVQPLLKREAPELSPVLTLLGMLIIYRETVSSVYGVDNLFVPMPFGFGRIEIGPFAGTSQSFFILLVSAITFFLIWLFFERTVWGKAFQAVAINRTAAAVLGINLRLVTALSFALGGGIAGLAGVLQAPITSVHFLMGLPLAIKGFSALVIGGVGRIEGALLGGLLLAFVEKITIRYAPIPSGMALGAPFLLLILFLLMRPSGLMKARGEQ